MMIEYVKFVADHLLHMLGHSALYNATLPFDFMHHISVESKSNFFEARVSEYSKAQSKREFDLHTDF